MSATTDDEQLLKVAVMRADLTLKTKQAYWETPRNVAILLGVAIAITGTLAGLAGYKLGSQPPQPIIIHLDTPAATR